MSLKSHLSPTPLGDRKGVDYVLRGYYGVRLPVGDEIVRKVEKTFNKVYESTLDEGDSKIPQDRRPYCVLFI